MAIFKEIKNIKRTMSGDERKEWKGFLADVDEDGVEEYEVEALLTLFELNKLWRPGKLVGLSEADMILQTEWNHRIHVF